MSVWDSSAKTAKELLDLADAALLEAKQAGRNCVRGPDLLAARAA